ncbi:MAG: aldo/keto reductase [Arenicellaceae bacterium]|nr:aldo/keto reductase [Arenicellaceae bacterium]
MTRTNTLSRRKFLAQTTAAAATLSLPMASFAQESMMTRAIPGSDRQIPVIGLGAPDMFFTTPPEGSELPKSLVQAMVDQGGRILDTPAFFRPDPPDVGGLVTEMDLQDALFLIGKITVEGEDAAKEHLAKTAANFRREQMDLMLIHNFKDVPTNWQVLKEAKEDGKVRHIGISRTAGTTNEALEQFMKTAKPDVIMIGYNMHQNEHEARILPLAQDMGIGVFVVEPFRVVDDGALFSLTRDKELPEWAAEFDCESWAQFSLKYILSNPAITGIITETTSVSHVVDNMRGGYGRLPDEAMRKRMSDHFYSML